MKTYLMLKTKDKRKFITHKKNLSLLREYVKTFNVKLQLVLIKGTPEILELEELAPALCDPVYDNKVECEVIKQEPKKRDCRKTAEYIRNFITNQLLSKKPLSLKDLKKKFEDLKLSDTCLSNHLSAIRKQLLQSGHNIVKIGGGKYQLNPLR